MRKTKIIVAALAGVFMASCTKTNVSGNGHEIINKKTQSSLFDCIESIKLGNDRNECENNILIFPSWNYYNLTIDKLGGLAKDYRDTFKASIPSGLTNEEYHALCAKKGFDEDYIFNSFENDLRFCSLRKRIADGKQALDKLQRDGQMDQEDNPDNHFIGDETERALLSEKGEVIIGDKHSGYTYYKLTDDKGGAILVHNEDLEAMVMVSNGRIPKHNTNVEILRPKKGRMFGRR
jgi:hypothetical protein